VRAQNVLSAERKQAEFGAPLALGSLAVRSWRLNMSELARSAGSAADPSQEAHRLFHRLWSKAYDSPGYDKREWLRFEELLRQLGLRI